MRRENGEGGVGSAELASVGRETTVSTAGLRVAGRRGFVLNRGQRSTDDRFRLGLRRFVSTDYRQQRG